MDGGNVRCLDQVRRGFGEDDVASLSSYGLWGWCLTIDRSSVVLVVFQEWVSSGYRFAWVLCWRPRPLSACMVIRIERSLRRYQLHMKTSSK